MQIYIRRDNEEFGPYSREAVSEYVKQGVFKAVDNACYAGMSEWKTVGDLLGINGASRSARGADLPRAAKITEFNPTWAPAAVQRQAAARSGGAKRGFMTTLNLVLLLIVAAVSYIRFGSGGHLVRPMARHYLAAISDALAKLANEQPQEGAARAAAASPAPVIAKEPAATSTPPPALAAAATPAPAAAAPPATAVATSAPAMVATPAPVASTPTLASAAMQTPDAADPAPASAQTAAPPAVSVPALAAAPIPAPPKPFDPADLAGNPGAWPKTVILRRDATFPALYNGQVVGSVTAPPGTVVHLMNMQGDQLVVEYQGGTQKLAWRDTDIEQEAAKSAAPAPPAPPTSGLPATATAPAATPASGPPAATPAPEAPAADSNEPQADN